jgi:hypothetical protein
MEKSGFLAQITQLKFEALQISQWKANVESQYKNISYVEKTIKQ